MIRETGVGHTHFEESTTDYDTKNIWDFTEVHAVPAGHLRIE